MNNKALLRFRCMLHKVKHAITIAASRITGTSSCPVVC